MAEAKDTPYAQLLIFLRSININIYQQESLHKYVLISDQSIIIAVHTMQDGISLDEAVRCSSVRLSVRQMRKLWQIIKNNDKICIART